MKDIDIIARTELYKAGLDYLHGTSHGVGHFLNVHEGPYDKPYQPGVVHTNEPGYYENGKFGIRIENMLICVQDPKFENFLTFKNITMFPYALNLLDKKLLKPEETDHINSYHTQVRSILKPRLGDDSLALEYLLKETEQIL
jgi:Xaa-Pro aminopeptidase